APGGRTGPARAAPGGGARQHAVLQGRAPLRPDRQGAGVPARQPDGEVSGLVPRCRHRGLCHLVWGGALMAFLDFDIREVFFLAVRLILAAGCALIGWFATVPLVHTVYYIVARRQAPAWVVAWL